MSKLQVKFGLDSNLEDDNVDPLQGSLQYQPQSCKRG